MYMNGIGSYIIQDGPINYLTAGFVQDHLIYWDGYAFTVYRVYHKNDANAL